MDVTAFDGRAFLKFVTAGTYFLRKYRGVLNDLNVFPVPDGDTGSNMYFTVRAALVEAGKTRGQALPVIAAAAASGSLLGARGNSGVILSQMLRGFAHNVRHRNSIDTFELAVAMKEAVAAARSALIKPVEGTILSVAGAAADAAYRIAQKERDFYRLANGVLRAAVDALERTPEQLPALKEAGVVDAGGAGFVYFFEAILRFLPDAKMHATAFPRRPVRRSVFSRLQRIGENRFCTEFVLEDAKIEAHALRDVLAKHGDSLIVAGAAPSLRVHIHTDDAPSVQGAAGRFGSLTRVKVDDMSEQHQLLVIDEPAKPFSVVAVVPGAGFDQIARELGAESTIDGAENPSVRDLLLGVNKCLSDSVYLLTNDGNIALAAAEAARLASKRVRVVPTRDIVGGLAVLLALSSNVESPPEVGALMASSERVASGSVFFAARDAVQGGSAVGRGMPAASYQGRLIGGTSEGDVLESLTSAMGAADGGLLTLYYGGSQREKDAQRNAAALAAAFPGLETEYYFGGQQHLEYVVSFER